MYLRDGLKRRKTADIGNSGGMLSVDTGASCVVIKTKEDKTHLLG